MTFDPRHLRILMLGAVLVAGLGPGACMKPNPLVATLAEGDESGTETGPGSSESETETGETDELPLPDLGASSCEPIAAFGDSCGPCLAESCCDLSSACEGDPDCLCLAACELADANMGSCQQSCGVNPKQVPLFQALEDCSADACAGSC